MKSYIYRITPPRPTFPGDATEAEEAGVQRHFEYLKALHEAGRVILVGLCEDATFGICIYQAESDEEAERVAHEDPAVLAGVFSVEWWAFRVVFER